MRTTTPFISIVIPTFQRYQCLRDTVSIILHQPYPAYEVLIVDQTPGSGLQPEDVWPEANGRVRYWHLSRPSVPHALNKGIAEAQGDIVLFLDDDVVPSDTLLGGHAECYADPGVGVVQGRVTDEFRRDPTPSPFGCLEPNGHAWGNPATMVCTAPIRAPLGCNLSVRREAVVRGGGIDPRFLPPFNLWEAEVCLRITRLGYTTTFAPKAHVEHLLIPTGGAGNRRPTPRRHYGTMFNTFLVACKHPDAVALRQAFAFRTDGSPVKVAVGLLALAHLAVVTRDRGVLRQLLGLGSG